MIVRMAGEKEGYCDSKNDTKRKRVIVIVRMTQKERGL